MKPAATPDVWRGVSQPNRMISGLRKMPPPVPVRPASRPSAAPAGRVTASDGVLDLAIGELLRLPEQAQRRDPEHDADQRPVIFGRDVDPAADERGRRRGHREGEQQAVIGLAAIQ